jgi:phosphatidate cytidylyltransferase
LENVRQDRFKKRLLTSLVLAPTCIVIIYAGGLPLAMLLLVCFMISHQELVFLSRKIGNFYFYYTIGLAYLLFTFASFYVVGSDKELSALIMVSLVAFSDMGAYFAGKSIGGPKLIPKISPNKTWAGLAGAIVTPAIALVMIEISLDVSGEKIINLSLFLLFGALIGLSGQAGDILISIIKRRAGVKDTGNLLPGHGGLLDRIDSLLLCAPVFIALEYLLIHVE